MSFNNLSACAGIAGTAARFAPGLLVALLAGLATGEDAVECDTVVLVADDRDAQRRQQQMKAEHDQKAAEHKRKFEQALRESQADQSRIRQQAARNFAKVRQDPSAQSAPAFNAATAPPPVECLKAYIAAAKSASSMDQLLNYLPLREAEALKERQARYDPRQAAANRESHRKRKPDMKEESLTFLTNPPYVNELNHHQRIANKIIDILSVKIDGNKALITVSTNSGATVNGERYSYGTAKIEMIGEVNLWRLASYNDSNIVYKDPPQPR